MKYAHNQEVFGIHPIRYGFNFGVNSRALSTTRRRVALEGFRLLAIRILLRKYRHVMTGSVPKFQRLEQNQLELSAMHLAAIRSGYESKSEWILVLEDDARISNENCLDIESVCNIFKSDETIFVNLNSDAGMLRTTSDPEPNKLGIYRVRPIAVRYTTSYFMNRNTALKILDLIESENLQDWLPVDYQMQIALQKIKAKTFWQDPPMFIQGSEDGSYKSNLR